MPLLVAIAPALTPNKVRQITNSRRAAALRHKHAAVAEHAPNASSPRSAGRTAAAQRHEHTIAELATNASAKPRASGHAHHADFPMPSGWSPSEAKLILDTYPVTRWWGRLRSPPPQGVDLPLPRLFKRFDWMVHMAVTWSRSADPRAVWATPGARLARPVLWAALPATLSGVGHAILGRLTLLHDWRVDRVPLNTSKLRVLVVAGEDTYFGVVRDEVLRLKPWFARIFYEVRRYGA